MNDKADKVSLMIKEGKIELNFPRVALKKAPKAKKPAPSVAKAPAKRLPRKVKKAII